MSGFQVLTIGPNGGAKIYTSASAASRALSGYGTDSLRNTIVRRLEGGGGFVNGSWVQGTNFPTGIQRP